ncbi:hypothetical protein PRIPAC_73002 [Pristionchus pacificus]|nr:hypothetical protein PRIPAC_73002 [Pristionchus pacificus]
MLLLSMQPFAFNKSTGPGVDSAYIFNVANEIRIQSANETERPNVAQLVIGFGEFDHEGFRQAITRAAEEFGNQTPMNGIAKEKEIVAFRKQNDEGKLCDYSRQCNICYAEFPDSRAVLTACGHVACMACVLQLENKGLLNCPFCRQNSGFVKLHETKSEDGEIKKAANEDVATTEKTTSLSSTNDSPSTPLSTGLPYPPPTVTMTLPTTFSSNEAPTQSRPNVSLPNPIVPHSTVSSNHPSDHRVYIGSLPPYATSEDVRQLFSGAGRVVDVILPSDLPSLRHRGRAFCYFADAESARNAVSMFNDYPLEDAYESRLRVMLPSLD